MIDPIVVTFDVAAAPDDAFATWTERAARWWPKAHTMSGAPAAIRFEPRLGGRIYEVARDGSEHEWGEILEWDPPRRVGYRWHLFFDRSQATDVEVTFSAGAHGGTHVRLVQSGFERLGAEGSARRERTVGGWSTVTAAYRAGFAA